MQGNVTKKKLEGPSKARVPKRIGVVVHMEKKECLFNSLVDTLNDPKMFDKLRVAIVLEVSGDMCVNYLTDDLVLIRGLVLEKAKQMSE